MRTTIATLTLATLLASLPAAATTRSAAAVAEFKRHNPCPATGHRRGACPGWVIDHIEPLCAGGADSPANMQWQTRADAILKDQDERRQCRQLRQQAR